VAASGRLTVNGTTATPGTTVTSSCELLLDGKPVANASPPQIFLYHKPRKVIVTRRKHRDENRRTIADELSDLGLPDTLKPVGRLDYMTSGLMLLTNDGELAHGLELSALPRTYLVKAYGGLHRQKLTSLQRHGWLR
jgi:23S rRNA pseudouridine2605 synthase